MYQSLKNRPITRTSSFHPSLCDTRHPAIRIDGGKTIRVLFNLVKCYCFHERGLLDVILVSIFTHVKWRRVLSHHEWFNPKPLNKSSNIDYTACCAAYMTV